MIDPQKDCPWIRSHACAKSDLLGRRLCIYRPENAYAEDSTDAQKAAEHGGCAPQPGASEEAPSSEETMSCEDLVTATNVMEGVHVRLPTMVSLGRIGGSPSGGTPDYAYCRYYGETGRWIGNAADLPDARDGVRLAILDSGATRVRCIYEEDTGPGNGGVSTRYERGNPHGFVLGQIVHELIHGSTDRTTVHPHGGGSIHPGSSKISVETDHVVLDRFGSDGTLVLGGGERGATSSLCGGGAYGSPANIETEIHEILTAQATAEPNASRWPLVINLSVGWDDFVYGYADLPDAPGTVLDERQLIVHRVEMALIRASCAGALIVAAAGNREPVPGSSTAPIFPAWWETRIAPDETLCNELNYPLGFGEAPAHPEPSFDVQREALRRARDRASGSPVEEVEPLVVSVGGYFRDPAGRCRPLRSTTSQGLPRLVAPAMGGFGKERCSSGQGEPASGGLGNSSAPGEGTASDSCDSGSKATESLTGTSVSAVYVSTVAALTWRLFPDLSRSQVLTALYEGGRPFPGEQGSVVMAQYCVGGQVCTDANRHSVRRVDMCGALEKALQLSNPTDWMNDKRKDLIEAQCQPPVPCGVNDLSSSEIQQCEVAPSWTSPTQFREVLLPTPPDLEEVCCGAEQGGSGEAGSDCEQQDGQTYLVPKAQVFPNGYCDVATGLSEMTAPFVFPSPPGNSCPECIVLDRTGWMKLNPDFETAGLVNAYIVMESFESDPTQTQRTVNVIPDGVNGLSSTVMTKVMPLAFPVGHSAVSAELVLTGEDQSVDSQIAHRTQILVGP